MGCRAGVLLARPSARPVQQVCILVRTRHTQPHCFCCPRNTVTGHPLPPPADANNSLKEGKVLEWLRLGVTVWGLASPLMAPAGLWAGGPIQGPVSVWAATWGHSIQAFLLPDTGQPKPCPPGRSSQSPHLGTSGQAEGRTVPGQTQPVQLGAPIRTTGKTHVHNGEQRSTRPGTQVRAVYWGWRA